MAWSPEKRRILEEDFYQFLDHCWIDSKDAGHICLGKSLYDGQRLLFKTIFDAKVEGINHAYVLKSRQLGISTGVRALIVFLLGMFRGLKGAIVFDTTSNRNIARSELEAMIEALPGSLQFPTIVTSNREGLTLSNNSKVLFMSAGIKKSKVSGTLGRSVGLSMATLSELCSYDNPDGLESFEQSLSEINPNAIYIRESTARGYNQWWQMWESAREDKTHCRCLFLGWYTKPQQQITRNHPDFIKYTGWPPTPKEEARMRTVKEQYGYTITPEQLAWIRWKMDPNLVQADEEDPLRLQEQPWTEEEAFQQTGSIFFNDEKLTDQTNRHVSLKYESYMFHAGLEFTDMRVIRTNAVRAIELKVWEEPIAGAFYVLGVDPAFGENEFNDRSSIQVLRCFSDGVDQVAEYAWPLINTRQLAWVVASLMGWYGQAAEVRYILELNGPGTAVFDELRSLRQQIDAAYSPKEYQERGLQNIFTNVRSYIYRRPDSMGGSQNFHFKTTREHKVRLMERLRDFVSNGMLHLRSIEVVNEMRVVAREGDSIGAPASMKDDRVMALALAIHQWDSSIRPELIGAKRTRLAEQARTSASIADQVYLFQKNQLDGFFERKAAVRRAEAASDLRARWRYR